MQELFDIVFTTGFGYSILRVTTPILFAALAALISDRAGVINIGLEGIMLISALVGVVAGTSFGSPWLGLIVAVLAGAFIGMVMAYFSLNLKTDIILTGIAINLMAGGGTVFALSLLSGNKGSFAAAGMALPRINIPLIESIPVVGPILSGHNILTYVSIIAVIVIYYFLYKTALGLRIRSVGENPDAAASVGVNVTKVKYIALIISGALAGFGGAYMSMGYMEGFTKNMTAGRGFIAMAAEAMGGASPIGTFFTSLFFGAADALSNSISALNIPPEFVQMTPYVATIIGLVIYSYNKKKRVLKAKKAKNK
ncbi:simple sugar transport system permease protein [Clostridium collagenovorans DSM 3089]|uniref:Simple sugar transport system permease protein n=1 Tax=Clostridium collagenovorans DSM 3089 TaxID=1121306 RepID=A0A1M5WN92_9CLOT|nr:ABC transporter permease [Clostridium collagenovorans]SHH89007.1 simple sugar transport system permease protein [Clostridium collagenovorans DSM 3089]